MPKTSSHVVTDTATESITIERTPGAVKCNAHNISDSGNDSTANISQHDKTLTNNFLHRKRKRDDADYDS